MSSGARVEALALSPARGRSAALLAEVDYARVEPRTLAFPRDHGAPPGVSHRVVVRHGLGDATPRAGE